MLDYLHDVNATCQSVILIHRLQFSCVGDGVLCLSSMQRHYYVKSVLCILVVSLATLSVLQLKLAHPICNSKD